MAEQEAERTTEDQLREALYDVYCRYMDAREIAVSPTGSGWSVARRVALTAARALAVAYPSDPYYSTLAAKLDEPAPTVQAEGGA